MDSQWFKEAEQEYKYREGPVHVDGEIAGSIIATVGHLQRELREAKAGQQAVNDCAFNANVQRRQAENEIAQLKRDLFGVEQGMLEARETAKKYEKQYRETLIELERVQAGNPTASNRADRALIQSLEEQLNNATQQLIPKNPFSNKKCCSTS